MNQFPPLRILAFLTSILFVSTVRAQTPPLTTRPIPQVTRVLIISIDGLRPDVMLRARTPTLRGLMDRGTFSLWAQTIPMAVTLPSHVSMLTGVAVEKHGIRFNDERAVRRPIYPNAVTLFELAKQSGYTTAVVAGKSKFISFNKPNTVDWYSAPENPKATDADVADAAGAILRLHKPQVMFLHFPGGDTTGHASGWGSPQQFAAIERIDELLGMILNSLQTSGLNGSTAIIISADHGGSGKNHGANDPRSLYIPWIISGPGIRQNLDLASFRELTVRTEDTFATACYLLGIPLPDGVDGKPIRQIVQRSELLEDAPAPAGTNTGSSGE